MCQIFKCTNRSSCWLSHYTSSDVVHEDAFKINIKNSSITKFINSTILDFAITTFNMNITDYWLMAREYLIWNAAIASLQFWAADLDPVTLSRATEEVYSTFFYSATSHTLHQQSDEILFGHFMTTLNAAFEWQPALADEGYESGSDTVNLPTPLRKMPRIHHVSSIKHASLNPDPVMPQNMFQTPPRPVCRWLSFSSSDDSDTSKDISPPARTTAASTAVCLEEDKEEEEDFQMVPLDYEHWTTEEVPNRTLCIHEHALPLELCPYPCPYVNYLIPSYAYSLDLSDISDLKDIMITSSDEDVPALLDMPYWKETGLI